MNYSIKSINVYDRQAKRLLKKYHSLRNELYQLVQSLKTDPFQGTPIGRGCYKIRLAIASKGKGKSGGARIITYVYVVMETIYLLSIYDKSEQVTISTDELDELMKGIQN